MAEEDAGKALLEGAYKLLSPADNIAYYRSEAAAYDTEFIQGMGYVMPRMVAAAYRAAAQAGDVPVADIGCGTGAVAEALGLPAGQIDGFDISPEMIEKAREKAIYRDLLACDLTASLDGLPTSYGAVVSAGTFTLGHLGPEVLRGLLPLARVGALFVIGVNARHYEAAKFADVLESMEKTGETQGLGRQDAPIYDRAGHAHSDDRAVLVTFRKG